MADAQQYPRAWNLYGSQFARVIRENDVRVEQSKDLIWDSKVLLARIKHDQDEADLLIRRLCRRG